MVQGIAVSVIAGTMVTRAHDIWARVYPAPELNDVVRNRAAASGEMWAVAGGGEVDTDENVGARRCQYIEMLHICVDQVEDHRNVIRRC